MELELGYAELELGYAELELGSEFELEPPEHSATQDPHPDGNPLHEAENGGRKHEPWVYPLLTSQELSLHVT